jgi:hypothetical protein
MSDTSYFDAYMRGKRSSSHKWKTLMREFSNLRDTICTVQPMTMNTGQTFTIRSGTYTIASPTTIPPNTTIRGEGFRPTYMRNS